MSVLWDPVDVWNDHLRLWIYPVSHFLISFCGLSCLSKSFLTIITQGMTCHFFLIIFSCICISSVTVSVCVCLTRWEFAIYDNSFILELSLSRPHSLSLSVLCFQGGSAMDHLLHAGHRPHPAGLLLLHRAAAGGGGASREEPGSTTGKQDQAAAEHAAGKELLLMMDSSWQWWSGHIVHSWHTDETSLETCQIL